MDRFFRSLVEVLVVTPLGDAVKLMGAGHKSGQVHQRVLHPGQIQLLKATPEREPFEVIRSEVLRANYGQNPWQALEATGG